MDKTPLAVAALVIVEFAFSLMFVGIFRTALGSVLGLVVVLLRFRRNFRRFDALADALCLTIRP